MARLFQALRASFAAAAFVALIGSAQASLTVSPVLLNLEATPGKQAELQVVNTGDSDMPIEITVTQIAIDRDGNVTESAAPDSLLIFPPQRRIGPKSTQVFRVQYVGEPLGEGVSFFVNVRQLPIEAPEGPATVQMLYNFKVVANLIPPSGRVQLDVLSAAVGSGSNGKPDVDLVLRNSGNQQAMMRDLQMRVVQEGAGGQVVFDQTFKPGQVAEMVGTGLILPGPNAGSTFPSACRRPAVR